MVDDRGTLRLTYDGNSLSFGTITGISDSFMKSCSTFPIVSLKAENTFTIESKTSKSFSITFTRVQPTNPNDGAANMARWTNGHWIETVKAHIDRWQCRSDGFRLTYVPSADNPYVSAIDERGYIKDFTTFYVEATPTKIKGSFEFHVGGMYIQSSSRAPTLTEEMLQSRFILVVYNQDRSDHSVLMSGAQDFNYLDSLEVHGGPETPFEYARFTIPRKKLMQVASSLFKTVGGYTYCDIVAGVNTVDLTIGGGSSSMTITKVKLNNDKYTITAYCNAERITGMTLSQSAIQTPSEWINYILTDKDVGLQFTSANIFKQYREAQSREVGPIQFKAGTNVWYILQVCAMCVGARVFFANNRAYVVNYTYTDDVLKDYRDVDLYPSERDELYFGSVLGKVDLGDEGVDTILNALSINCSTPSIDSKTGLYVRDEDENIQFASFAYYTYEDESSISHFNTQAGNTLYLMELKQNDPNNPPKRPSEGTGGDEGEEEDTSGEVEMFNQAEIFAENYVAYRAEPQQSISFTLKEMRRNSSGYVVWHPFFGPASVASSITDDVDDTRISNISVITKNEKPQLLALSSYCRMYPEGKTEYNWGVLNTIDLSSSTSQINTGLSNVKS